MSKPVKIDYYTDILCVWAYFGQIKIDELQKEFGNQIEISHKFISLFGNNEVRIAQGWAKGGYAGYSQHVLKLAAHFPNVIVHPEIWMRHIPASSMPVHLLLKAVQLLESRGELPERQEQTLCEALAWQLRLGFFRDLENIADAGVYEAYLQRLGIPPARVQQVIANGEAFAALALDMEEQKNRMVEGSPTLIMNEGRQRLYGNVGYRAIAANVQELLERKIDLPDWC
jgi:predicted DsbA family dithiol-disulfide isomerase